MPFSFYSYVLTTLEATPENIHDGIVNGAWAHRAFPEGLGLPVA